MEKLVVTGVDEAIGANLALALSDRFEVLGLSFGGAVELDGCETASVSWDSPMEACDRVMTFRPDWLIHCGPTARNAWDQLAEEECPSEQSLFDMVGALGGACEALKARYTVLSTDAVFAGPRLFHEEFAPATCLTWLSAVALRIEQSLKNTGALCVRTHAFGWSPGCEVGYAERMWKALTAGARCQVDVDRHATPILATDLADVLERCYQAQLRGLLHLGGAERTSPFRFAAELANTFGLTGRMVRLDPVQLEGPMKLPLQETSLNSWRARRMLRTPLPMLREALARFSEQSTNGWRNRMQTNTLLIPSVAPETPAPVLERAA